MTPDHTSRELLELLRTDASADTHESCPLVGVWRDAEADAQAAYAAWQQSADVDAYVTYLAAEERAAAAQDDLAAWTKVRNAWSAPPSAPVAV